MNETQKQILAYMKEVCEQEDIYFYEAWKQVEEHVLDAVAEITTQPHTSMETGPGYTECEEGWGFMCDNQN